MGLPPGFHDFMQSWAEQNRLAESLSRQLVDLIERIQIIQPTQIIIKPNGEKTSFWVSNDASFTLACDQQGSPKIIHIELGRDLKLLIIYSKYPSRPSVNIVKIDQSTFSSQTQQSLVGLASESAGRASMGVPLDHLSAEILDKLMQELKIFETRFEFVDTTQLLPLIIELATLCDEKGQLADTGRPDRTMGKKIEVEILNPESGQTEKFTIVAIITKIGQSFDSSLWILGPRYDVTFSSKGRQPASVRIALKNDQKPPEFRTLTGNDALVFSGNGVKVDFLSGKLIKILEDLLQKIIVQVSSITSV